VHRGIVPGIAIGGALLLVLDALAVRMGFAEGAIPKLAGPSLWITSRAAGVTAFLALTLDVVFGLFVSTRAVDRLIPRARSVDIHRWLSAVALTMSAVHALALLGDRFVRFDVLDLLVPFLSSYRSVAVALGVLAAYGALLVHVSFSLRRRIGPKTWRKVHYLSFFVFAAALLHGLFAGSDARTPEMQALYVSSATLVGVLGLYRVFRVAHALRRLRLGVTGKPYESR
jgi:methionine sulfoxide reductase heme-binding subunit